MMNKLELQSELSKAKAEIEALKSKQSREVFELRAQQIHLLHSASQNLRKAGRDGMMGSGVILRLEALGGKDIIDPVMISDGLSDATIEALQSDLRRTFEHRTEFRPKGALIVDSKELGE